MTFKLTKAYIFVTLLFQLKISIWGESKLFFFRNSCSFNSANKFCYSLLTVASRNGTLEVLRFLTEKGADVSVRDVTTNSAVHFHAVPYNVDIIKLQWGIKVC